MKLLVREKHRNHNPGIYWTLTMRHFRIFFKNKLTLFFSLLVPLITLVIYVIFLRRLEINAIDGAVKEILKSGYSQELLSRAHLLADAWMLSGIVVLSTITVSLNTCYIMIQDREKGANKDFVSSPISRRSVNASYFIFNILATFLITFCVLIVCFIALWILGGVQISVGHCFLLIPILLLSVISSSLVTCFICSFIANSPIFNSIMAIASSASGFLIGVFMPITMLPTIASKITLFFPGTYCAGLMRTYFLTDYYANFKTFMEIEEKISPEKIREIEEKLNQSFSMNIDFFGHSVTPAYMVLAIFVFIVLFAILNVIFIDHNFRISLSERGKGK